MAGTYTDKQLDRIAKHAAKGIMAELDGDKDAADAHYRRAQVVTRTADLGKKK